MSDPETMSAGAPDGPGPQIALPARLDLRRALDIYVRGRSQTLGPAEKAAVADGGATRPLPRPSEKPTVPASVRVGVPQRLQFHRGAGTWRQPGSVPKRGESPDAES